MTAQHHFEQIAKRSKRKQLLKTTFFASLLVLSFLLLGIKVLVEITSRNGRRILERYDYLNQVAYPNIHYKNYYFHSWGLFSGEFISNRVKNIDGIEVPFEPMRKGYSITQLTSRDDDSDAYWDSQKTGVYSQGEQLKIPVFYNTRYDYQDKEINPPITQDLMLVNKLPNQAAEVAITFDKPYSYKEIQGFIPENILINWYWIGSKGSFDTTDLSVQDTLGIMSFDDGKLSDQAFQQFRHKLEEGVTSLSWLDSTYGTGNDGKSYGVSIKDDAKNYLKHNKTLQKAKFSGIIVSGRTENLAQLAHHKWIFASNIGQSVKIQPYHKLTK